MKIKIALAVLALAVGSAVTFRLVTGRCPIGALCHMVHGDAKTPAD
jgi:hypothetical protein